MHAIEQLSTSRVLTVNNGISSLFHLDLSLFCSIWNSSSIPELWQLGWSYCKGTAIKKTKCRKMSLKITMIAYNILQLFLFLNKNQVYLSFVCYKHVKQEYHSQLSILSIILPNYSWLSTLCKLPNWIIQAKKKNNKPWLPEKQKEKCHLLIFVLPKNPNNHDSFRLTIDW